ncbi:MAG: branched-chain amino acid ABC transporter permease [Actinobacteria bacterium]|nr:branched-chain amino acid ABC transporter permease [Actinomycetota bacterium]
MLRWKYSRHLLFSLLAFLIAIPLLPVDFFRSAGFQQTLAVALLYGALAVIINRNVGGWTNAENGLPLDAERIPSIFVGVANTHYIFWLSIAILVLTYAVVWWVTESPAGRVFAALRDNETRVSVLGLNGSRFKLLSFTIAAALASIIGVGMLIASGSAAPRYAEANTTIALLLMVILGGAISRWGAVLGGVIYSVSQTRLQDLTQSGFLDGLPKFIGGPLEEPVFILGLIFIFIVMFSPGGISGAYYRLRLRYLANKSKTPQVKA